MQAIDFLSLQFPNTQFIITAHSPLIVQAAGDNANIILLRRVPREDGNGQEVIVENDPKRVKGWRIDQLLTSDLYGLPSTRSTKYRNLFRRHLELIKKDSLTELEQAELDHIEHQLEKEAPPEAVTHRRGRNSVRATNGKA